MTRKQNWNPWFRSFNVCLRDAIRDDSELNALALTDAGRVGLEKRARALWKRGDDTPDTAAQQVAFELKREQR